MERGRGRREIQVNVLVLLIATDYLTDACERSSVSKMRFMLLDICMISPLIRHSCTYDNDDDDKCTQYSHCAFHLLVVIQYSVH